MRTILNKRGATTDLFLFMIISFIIAVAVVILYFAGVTMYEKLHENIEVFENVLEGTGENATDVIDNTVGKVIYSYQALKWITAMLIIGMFLSIILTSFIVQTRPWFFIPYILVWVMSILISVPLSNTYEKIYNTPMLTEFFSGFFGQTYIFVNLPVWITVIGAVAGVVMFVNMMRQEDIGGYV